MSELRIFDTGNNNLPFFGDRLTRKNWRTVREFEVGEKVKATFQIDGVVLSRNTNPPFEYQVELSTGVILVAYQENLRGLDDK